MDAISMRAPARALASRPAGLLSDERLARRVAAGDRAAFAEVFRRYHAQIYRYCRSLLRCEEDARDALQNTMASAMRALEGETREIALRPWLYRIAHNESMTLARRLHSHEPLHDETAETTLSVEERVLGRERHAQLVADLGGLPERQRGALLMRELSGLSHGDIAVALAITPAAAKQAIYEARTMLHELEEGRAMACVDVRRLISDGDGRVLRGRSLRAHLRSCEGCSTFRDAITTRGTELRAIAPPLAPVAAMAMLHSLVGGGGGAGAASAGAAGGAAAGVGKVLGGSLAAKVAVVGAVAAVGAGGLAATGPLRSNHSQPHPPPAPAVRHDAGRQAPSSTAGAAAAHPGRAAHRGPTAAVPRRATAHRVHRPATPPPAALRGRGKAQKRAHSQAGAGRDHSRAHPHRAARRSGRSRANGAHSPAAGLPDVTSAPEAFPGSAGRGHAPTHASRSTH